METALRAWIGWTSFRDRCRAFLADQAGEGVISTAIAVLIMALIGAAMWAVFQAVFNDAGQRIQSNIQQIQ
jgi:hypothetical protein